MISARLHHHPASPCSAITSFVVNIDPQGHLLNLSYLLSADLEQLSIPKYQQIVRADDLWKHSCFELFVLDKDGAAYQEFNFSPSGAWAQYRFSGYRKSLPMDEHFSPPGILTRHEQGHFTLNCSVSIATEDSIIGLSAVIEDKFGSLSYWALNHPSDKPDFHHAGAFTLKLK